VTIIVVASISEEQCPNTRGCEVLTLKLNRVDCSDNIPNFTSILTEQKKMFNGLVSSTKNAIRAS
jgi:hypothetical protein